MKALLVTGWSFMRLLRLATGLVGIVFGLKNNDTLLGFAGFFLLLMAAFNLGCCGVGGCTITTHKESAKPRNKEQGDINFEEVA